MINDTRTRAFKLSGSKIAKTTVPIIAPRYNNVSKSLDFLNISLT